MGHAQAKKFRQHLQCHQPDNQRVQKTQQRRLKKAKKTP